MSLLAISLQKQLSSQHRMSIEYCNSIVVIVTEEYDSMYLYIFFNNNFSIFTLILIFFDSDNQL